jgi:hypothetical protein
VESCEHLKDSEDLQVFISGVESGNGRRVMILDNPLIQRGISNSSIRTLAEIKHTNKEMFPIAEFTAGEHY